MAEVNSSTQIEYRQIQGFPGYRVGTDGSVWSCRPKNGRGPLKSTWRKLRLQRTPEGYSIVTMFADGVRKIRLVHEVVLTTFIGNRPDGMQACHFPDSNKANNCLQNLRWDSRQANEDDKQHHGTKMSGSKNHQAKLIEDDVPEIIRLHQSGLSHRAIASLKHVSKTTIGYILRNKSWRHVKCK